MSKFDSPRKYEVVSYVQQLLKHECLELGMNEQTVRDIISMEYDNMGPIAAMYISITAPILISNTRNVMEQYKNHMPTKQ